MKEIPRLATIHDLCGYGNCSLGIVKPVVSAAGVEVCAVPTAYLSSHTAFPHYSFVDTTPNLPEYFQKWQDLEIKLDGVYTGFLGSALQIDLIEKFFDDFSPLKIIVDPVMADHGKIYKTYTQQMCQKMERLAARADILTPNITEAKVLLGRSYKGQNYSTDDSKLICHALLNLGAKNVVLKGIERGDGKIRNAIIGENIPYTETVSRLHEDKLHGTGDLFASLIVGSIFAGHDLVKASQFAADMVYEAIKISTKQSGYKQRGVSFEPLMFEFAQFMQKKK